jgi:hypothetical protein
LASIKDDAELDLAELKRLLQRVQQAIHAAPNDVRSSMNGFVIATGAYVKPLTDVALQTGERIGPVTVDMGDTACQVPFAPDYIRKVEKRGAVGKKRKTPNQRAGSDAGIPVLVHAGRFCPGAPQRYAAHARVPGGGRRGP